MEHRAAHPRRKDLKCRVLYCAVEDSSLFMIALQYSQRRRQGLAMVLVSECDEALMDFDCRIGDVVSDSGD